MTDPIQPPTPLTLRPAYPGQPQAKPLTQLLPQPGPTPQDYADALDRLIGGATGDIRTPAALGTNLMADALDRYGLMRARKAAAAQSDAASAPYLLDRYRGTLQPVNPDLSSVDRISLDPGQ